MIVRALICRCGHEVRAEDDERLEKAVFGHITEDHPEMAVTEEQVHAMVEAEAKDA